MEETRSQYQARKAREREVRWLRWDYDMERCARCGLARCNVGHTVDREHSIEGPAYYEGVPFCEFESSGALVDGATTVAGYRGHGRPPTQAEYDPEWSPWNEEPCPVCGGYMDQPHEHAYRIDEVPVINGVATLPDGRTVRSSAQIVRVPVLLRASSPAGTTGGEG